MTRKSVDLVLSSPGTVYLVGAGPGDPGLITVKGLQKIREADVLVYDYLADPNIVAEARPSAELKYVGKQGGDHTLHQAGINELLVEKSREGKSVVRLKGGDPFVFGRGGEEAEELVQAGVPFEVVPGVTSAVAAPAYAGIPVTHRDHASMVSFVTGHEDPDKPDSAIRWDILAGSPGTLVFLMGVKNLPEISSRLMEYGKPADTPAALVRWGSTPRQESLISTLGEISGEAARLKFKPPAVLVVGHVVSLAGKLAWFDRKPLFAKRILVTRSKEQSRRMADQIATLGGEAVLFPTISIEPALDFEPLDNALKAIGSYDWVIFTSVNGVDWFFRRFYEVCKDIRELAGPRIGAIGPVTADSLKARGLAVELLAKEFTAEGVLELLSKDDLSGQRFLLPRAEKARDVLPDGIRALGGKPDVVTVYRTVRPAQTDVDKISSMLRNNALAAVTFTSSSTVNHLVEMLPDEDLALIKDRVVVASIGPITSATLREKGFPIQVEASEYTVPGLVAALAAYFRFR